MFNEQDFGLAKKATILPESIEIQTETSEHDPEPQEPERGTRRSERSRHPPVRYGCDEYVATVSMQHVACIAYAKQSLRA